jgi:nuclear pore complex protein Nup205
LNIDELEAAKIFLVAQEASKSLDRSPLACALIQYHESREILLEIFRLVLKLSLEETVDEEPRSVFQQAIHLSLHKENTIAGQKNGSVGRCIEYMGQVRSSLFNLAQKIQNISVIGRAEPQEIAELIEFQRASLLRQHESLGCILFYLVKSKYASADDFKAIISKIKAFDKYDNLLAHFIPGIAACITELGAAEGSVTFEEARALNEVIKNGRDSDPWILQYFQAAISAWWLSEYSGWLGENVPGLPSNVDVSSEMEKISLQFLDCLKEGAFDFILSLSGDVRERDWLDPAKEGLREWLQRKSPVLPPDSSYFSSYFTLLIMEQLETFVDAFITNMPDTLRKLKIDEEEQILLRPAEDHNLDLEKFLLTVSYVFDRPDSALSFWEDVDGNLFGFLQWSAKRQTTPLASAFCEMLSSLSRGLECASAAHRFLLEEGIPASGKFHKVRYMCWDQILSSLSYYSQKIRDKPTIHHDSSYRTGRPSVEEAELEPDVAFMLESYLRLITNLAQESPSARSWLWTQPKTPLMELLLLFCSSGIPSRIRACAFSTITAMLVGKSRENGESAWQMIDQWISGASNLPNGPGGGNSAQHAAGGSESLILRNINEGFEEPNAFIRLLKTLVLPYESEGDLNDSLPFPEYIGSSSRMPGIEPYVDFAMAVFGTKIKDMADVAQIRILRLSCLDFIVVCLSTFNEDLLSFASEAGFPVDAVIKASSLATYAQLHPFARVMEWLFSDTVLQELFRSCHEEADLVAQSSPESPLVLSVIRGLEVVSLALKLQATYLNVVKPLIKDHSPNRGLRLPASVFSRLEDAVLGHLQIVIDLGLYSRLNNESLSLISLKLLEQFATNSRLNASTTAFSRRSTSFNPLVSAIEADGEFGRVSRSLLPHLVFAEAELEAGPTSSKYILKTAVIDFLSRALNTARDQPSIAHQFLGFQVTATGLEIPEDGVFAEGLSLFHGVMNLLLEYPDREGRNAFASWLIRLKWSAMQVFVRLWTASLTAVYTLSELRSHDFFFAYYLRQATIESTSSWDGLTTADPAFLVSDSAAGLRDYLHQRAALYDLCSAELRYTAQQRAPSLQTRILSTLLGTTKLPNGDEVQNASIFDLFDFTEIILPEPIEPPALNVFNDVNFDGFKRENPGMPAIYDVSAIEEVLLLKHADFDRRGFITDANTEHMVEQEAQALLMFFQATNQLTQLRAARFEALRAWSELIMVIVQTKSLDGRPKIGLILQTLETVLPKLEQQLSDDIGEAVELARLGKLLISELDVNSKYYEKGHASDVINDRLFTLFKISLRGVHATESTPILRENLYSICYSYLTKISQLLGDGKLLQRHSTKTISASGERLLDIICDDAQIADEPCRTSAILVLDAFVSLANDEHSSYIIDSLNRINFVKVLVDSLQDMPAELEATSPSGLSYNFFCQALLTHPDIPSLFTYYMTKLSLLLRLSQSRAGASCLLSTNLFEVVRESRLFSIDPDLGLGMAQVTSGRHQLTAADVDNNESLNRFYELLLAVLKIINAIVVSKGEQHAQTIGQARAFLEENRPTVVSIFKRNAKIGGYESSTAENVERLVEALVVLMAVTDFVEVSSIAEFG